MIGEFLENRTVFYILMVFAMVAWGASWVNAKVLSNYITAYEMIVYRFSLSALALYPVLLFRKEVFRLDIKTFVMLAVSSVLLILYMKYYFLGTKYGTASLGGALVTTLIPINIFILMTLFFGKKATFKDILALFIGGMGVMTMLNVWDFRTEEIFSQHNVYFLLASLFWPVITVISSRATRISPLIFTFYLYVFSSGLCVLVFVEIDRVPLILTYDGLFWLNILFVSVISTTFATSIYFMGVEKLGAKEVSSFIFLVPFSAISLSCLFLGESIGYSIVMGTLMTILAVYMLNNVQLLSRVGLFRRNQGHH